MSTVSLVLLVGCAQPALYTSTDPAEWGLLLDDPIDGVVADAQANVTVSAGGLLTRYAGDGERRWSEAVERPGGAVIGVDARGQVWLGGTFRSQWSAGDTILHSEGGDDQLLAGFDADGGVFSAWSGGGAGQDDVLALAAGGRIAIAGDRSAGQATDSAAYVASFEHTGSLVWERALGEQDGERGQWAGPVAVGEAGQVAIAGGFEGELEIDGVTLTLGGLVALFDEHGALLWATDHDPSESVDSIGVGPEGEVFAVLSAPSSAGGWTTQRLVAFEPTGEPRWAWDLPAELRVTAPMAVDRDGAIWIAGVATRLELEDGGAQTAEVAAPFVAAVTERGTLSRGRLLQGVGEPLYGWVADVRALGLGAEDQVVIGGALWGEITVGDGALQNAVESSSTPFFASLLLP